MLQWCIEILYINIACELHLLARILGIKIALKNHTNESNPIHSLTWRAFTIKAPPLPESNEDGVILQMAPNIKIP
jgi:hypothetical protein